LESKPVETTSVIFDSLIGGFSSTSKPTPLGFGFGSLSYNSNSELGTVKSSSSGDGINLRKNMGFNF